jgi:hypothetical protein
VLTTGLALFVAGSEALVHQAMRNDGYEDYRARFRAAAGETIAIGDSRTAANIARHPAIENLGQVGDDLGTVLAKLAARHARQPLKRVALQADPHQFAAYRVFKPDIGKLEDLLGTSPPLAMLRPYYRQYLFAYWSVALRDPRRFWRMPDATASTPAPAMRPGTDSWRALARDRVGFHLPLHAPERLALAANYRASLARLIAEGVEVCVVTHPVSRAYRDEAARHASFDAALAFYDRVARELGATRANFWAALDDAAFGDTDHLRRCESIGSAESRHESYQALATLRSSEKSINSQILSADAAPDYTRRLLAACFDSR